MDSLFNKQDRKSSLTNSFWMLSKHYGDDSAKLSDSDMIVFLQFISQGEISEETVKYT